MEEDIKQLIQEIAKARKTAESILVDCPDVKEGRFISKALRELNTAMEFVVSAKNYKSDILDHRHR